MLCPFQMSILINTFVACHNKFKIRIEKGPMTESVVFFSKHKCIACSPGQCISHLKCTTFRKCFIQIGHLGLHILYKHFCVLSFHSVLCFPNYYHRVEEEKWNINDLKNINYNEVSVSKVCARLICSGGICLGGIRLVGICPRGFLSRW